MLLSGLTRLKCWMIPLELLDDVVGCFDHFKVLTDKPTI